MCISKTCRTIGQSYFFHGNLANLAERCVLKHEAYVMLKHIFQIRDPNLPINLYNIAADIEVNQYIGHP